MTLAPELWGDFAVGALLRPPENMFPLLWHQIVSLIASLFGLEATTFILRWSGFLFLILAGYLVSKLAMMFLPSSLFWVSKLRSGRILRFMLGFLSAGLFCLSEPVWRAAQSFSPDMFRLFLFLLMVTFSVRSLKTYRYRDIFLAAILTGVFAAESLLGFVSFAMFGLLLAKGFCDLPFMNAQASEFSAEATESSNSINVFSRRFAAGNFISFFLLGLLITVASNLYFYYSTNPTKNLECEAFGIASYFARYFYLLFEHSNIPGACILLVFVVVPFVYACVIRNRAIDITRPFPASAKLIFSLSTIFLLLQSFDWTYFWFFSWLGKSSAVCSNFVLLISLLATSITASFSLCALLIEIFFRNYARYEMERANVYADEADLNVPSRLLSRRSVEIFLAVISLMIISMLVYPKVNSLYSRAGEIIDDAAKTIAKDCEGEDLIITDGALDSAIECLVAMNGGSIKAMSVMGTKPYDAILRTRGETNEEQRVLLELSAAKALTAWIRTKSPRLDTLAAQIGFEAWSQNNIITPLAGGLLARDKWNGDSSRDESIKSAHDLSRQILDLRKNGADLASELGRTRYYFLSHLQFRLARLAQLRATQALSKGNDDVAKKEQDLADSLNNANPEYSYIRENFRRIARDNAMKLTAKEGLDVGFFMRDLNFSRFYAEQVIKISPDDFKANYALGMGALVDKEYVRAEMYLQKCSEIRKDDPIVLNNLAVVYLRLNRFAEATKYSTRACELAPKSAEFKKTLEDIKNAQQKLKEK